MENYYLQTIGKPVTTEDGRGITRIRGIFINPDTGKIVGFPVMMPGNKVISPIDIAAWNREVKISDPHDIVEAEEIHQVQSVFLRNVPIYKNKVETKSGESLGRVIDFAFNTGLFSLTKLVVAKSFLGLFYWEKRIIDHQDILEIKKDKIIVKNRLRPIKMKKFKLGMATPTAPSS